MSTFEERKAVRLATWHGGVVSSFAELAELDERQWQSVSPADRLKAIWSLVADERSLRGEPTMPRLRRDIGGVRPLRPPRE